ncbi:hypothetical protein FQZ97_1050900 [compost metagenome]
MAWLLSRASVSIAPTIFSMLHGSSPSRMRGAKMSQIMATIEAWLSPRYQEDVSPDSAIPTSPVSVCSRSSSVSSLVMVTFGNRSGFFSGIDTGMHSTFVIFMVRIR